MVTVKMTADAVTRSVIVRAEGHAGTAPVGQDIVCSAVTAVLMSYALYAESLPKERCFYVATRIDDGEAVIALMSKDVEGYHDTLEALKPIRLGLEAIAETYPDAIKIIPA